MTSAITSGPPLDVSSMAVHQNVSWVSLEYLIVGAGAGAGAGGGGGGGAGAGAGAGADAGADEKSQQSKIDHRPPYTHVLRFLIPELEQTGLIDPCGLLHVHL